MELHLQRYLRSGRTVEDLEKEFGVYSYVHQELPLIGFKYGLIESKTLKFHPIVREARGIVLERDSWEIVAYPFNRFFNLGEDLETERLFNWNNFSCQEKLDGSLIIIYHYAGRWHVNTSGSFGKGICYDSGRSWEELFWDTSGIDKRKLHLECTYIFELWTKHNKIVRSYKPSVWLLGMKADTPWFGWNEVYKEDVDCEAGILGVPRPAIYDMHSIDEILNFLKVSEANDPTFEGFVLCDDGFRRIKVKNDSYRHLHNLKGNGQFLCRNIIPQLLRGNANFLLQTIPEWTDEIEQYVNEIDCIKTETANLWWEFKDLDSRKEFAQRIIQYATLPALLFNLKDGKYATVEEAISQSEALLIKYFEGKK